jgi:hypothetical protein
MDEVRRLMAQWWADNRCCPSDWCALGGIDRRLGQVLAELGIVDPEHVR